MKLSTRVSVNELIRALRIALLEKGDGRTSQLAERREGKADAKR
ncbi:MAG: hypothetical protein AAGI92_06540 [Pseudomonadota bacterium]